MSSEYARNVAAPAPSPEPPTGPHPQRHLIFAAGVRFPGATPAMAAEPARSPEQPETDLNHARRVGAGPAVYLACRRIRFPSVACVRHVVVRITQVIVVENVEEIHLELQPVCLALEKMKRLQHAEVPLSETRTKYLVRGRIAPGP